MSSTTDKRLTDTKEKLILAGLKEITENGINDFSTRRIAKKCGLSCSAPYKHFKDTKTFIEEIFLYVKRVYDERQKDILEKYSEASYREQLTQLSLVYIIFLTEYPLFLRMIMQLYENDDENFRLLSGRLSKETFDIVGKYCDQVGMPAEIKKRKLFIVRAIIYASAMFFVNGELEYNKENMKVVESLIAREFDLP